MNPVRGATARDAGSMGAAGSLVGRYRLDRVIGSGSSAVVYAATDTELGRCVALKLAHADVSADQHARASFLAVARTAAAMDHEAIVPVFDIGEVEARPFVAMRLVYGHDLRWMIDREGVLAPSVVAMILAQVAAALDAAHEHGVVHGDLKPENIIVGRSDAHATVRAYVTDFAGGMTRGYAAPEQQRGEELDPLADVYSLGTVLFECLTGAAPAEPFVDRDGALSVPSLHAPTPSVSERRPDLPVELDAIVSRAMAMRPDQRFSTCRELMQAVRPFLHDRGRPTVPPNRPVDPRPPTDTRPDRAPGDHPRRRLGAGIAVVLALLVALVFVREGSGSAHRAISNRPVSHRAASSPTRPPIGAGPSIVRGLLARVPVAVRPTCRVSSGHLPGARAEVRCRGTDATTVVYGAYPDRGALAAAFRDRRLPGPLSGTAGADPACATGTPEVRSWRHAAAAGPVAGDYRCAVVQRRALLTWTTRDALILAEAQRGDANLTALFSWWQREPGPLETGPLETGPLGTGPLGTGPLEPRGHA